MKRQWWLLVALFATSVTLLVVGLIIANTGMAIAGVAIGMLLYLTRRYFSSV